MSNNPNNQNQTTDKSFLVDPALITSIWPQVAALAWKGYVASGRGVVFVDVHAPVCTIWYVSDMSIQRDGGWRDHGIGELLHIYLPAREVVIIVIYGDHHLAFRMHLSDTPPMAYEKVYGVTLCDAA